MGPQHLLALVVVSILVAAGNAYYEIDDDSVTRALRPSVIADQEHAVHAIPATNFISKDEDHSKNEKKEIEIIRIAIFSLLVVGVFAIMALRCLPFCL
uniref:Secreted RxLR effector protein BLR05 n=1 Tax=Bremia lactucae TaxID=4779 RepID=BRL05_BRELC|nr:RecName: Full=Secreted RxLR effector protein BLR05; Flags: Precursor [Bremia lactucae]